MYQIYFYVPEESKEAVKQAMFDAGAGQIGLYQNCSWEIKGIGQFKPLSGSQPHIGQIDEIEQVDEYKVEMVVEEYLIEPVLLAMKSAHPYEEPAYGVIKLATF